MSVGTFLRRADRAVADARESVTTSAVLAVAALVVAVVALIVVVVKR